MTTVDLETMVASNVIEKRIAEVSFRYFLDHVRILNRTGEGDESDIKFELWEHLVELSEDLPTERRLNIGKSRQIGVSWILAAYSVWKVQYSKGALVMLFSQGEDESQSFLAKCKFIYKNLPRYLTVQIGTNSTTTMSFPEMDSKIVAYPSTENAGRGETATVVIQDEFAFHRYADANLLAVKPTIDAGGQLIQASTINKADLNGPFATTHREAPDNGYAWRFYGWQVRPERDQEWYEQTEREAPETEELSAALYMEQEYPGTREEMLRPSSVLAAFDLDALDAMMRDDVKEPIETKGIVNIYQHPRVGNRYCAGADVAHGVGQDESVLTVLDVRSGFVVADIHSAYVDPEDFALEVNTLLKDYYSPLVGVEDNEWGKVVVNAMKRLSYPRVYESRKDVPGWHTDARTRPLLWSGLMTAVKNRQIVLPSRHGIGQFMSVIRNPDKNGRIEAMAGTHDDYPMAAGIAWQMRDQAFEADQAKVDDLTPATTARGRRSRRRRRGR